MIKNYNDHAANERTFLAWVRTAMAVVGFGIAAARLGIRRNEAWTEVGLLVVGGITVLIAYVRMRMIRKLIDSDANGDDDNSAGDLLLLALVISFFTLMVLFILHIA